MKKPARQWHEFLVDDGALFGMAAVTQRGRTADGRTWFTCYSIVMRPAPEHLAGVHDRMPVLIPASLSDDWLTAEPGGEIVDDALLAAADLDDRVRVAPARATTRARIGCSERMDARHADAAAAARADELPGSERENPFGPEWDVYKVRGRVFLLAAPRRHRTGHAEVAPR